MATIGGYPLRKLIKNSYIAALLGATSGLTYKQLKIYPQKIKKILVYSSVSGCAGLLLGGCYGYFSKRKLFFTGLKGAGTFYLVSCSFLGINEALRVSEFVKTELGSTKKLRFIETTTSGLITGFIIGSFWWKNPVSFITTAAAFGAITGAGQLINDRVENWRVQKAILLKYPELAELEWHALSVNEQDAIKEKNKVWWERLYAKLLDRPLLGKLRLKQQSLFEELELLRKEESELLTLLGLEQDEDVDIPDIIIVR